MGLKVYAFGEDNQLHEIPKFIPEVTIGYIEADDVRIQLRNAILAGYRAGKANTDLCVAEQQFLADCGLDG
jgi:hypothetical protein